MRRILTAALLIPAAIWLVLWGPPPALVAAGMLFTLTSLWEFFRLADAATGVKSLRVPGYVFGLTITLLPLSNFFTTGMVAATGLFLMLVMAAAMSPRRAMPDYFKAVSATFLGVAYTAVPITLLVWVCLQPDGPYWTLFLLVVVWAGDTAGYFVGRSLGTHQSFPRVSPGKTWEGTAGSFAAACLVGVLYERFLWEGASYGKLVLLAGVLNVAAQFGDLAESALKRSAGVKDSSQLVPGHGGVLDRIDALLFAAPVLWYYWLVRGAW